MEPTLLMILLTTTYWVPCPSTPAHQLAPCRFRTPFREPHFHRHQRQQWPPNQLMLVPAALHQDARCHLLRGGLIQPLHTNERWLSAVTGQAEPEATSPKPGSMIECLLLPSRIMVSKITQRPIAVPQCMDISSYGRHRDLSCAVAQRLNRKPLPTNRISSKSAEPGLLRRTGLRRAAIVRIRRGP